MSYLDHVSEIKEVTLKRNDDTNHIAIHTDRLTGTPFRKYNETNFWCKNQQNKNNHKHN